MSRRLLVLNVLAVALAAGVAMYVVWELTRPGRPGPTARPRPVAPAGAPVLATPTAPEPGAGAWTTIASRNLFSPTRSEAPTAPVPQAVPLANLPKPMLYGVVLRDGSPIAYLEDPVTRRVSAYRVGDTVAGATLKTIGRDHVVLTRPEGTLDVRLHDPSKPRPAAPPPTTPGVIPGLPPAAGTVPPGTQPVPGQVTDPTGRQPVRRLIPPNLIRRLPQVPQAQPGGSPQAQPADEDE